jgi:2-methylcitrate dehydratase PrpD
MDATKTLIELVARVDFRQLPGDVVEKTKISILDWFICCLAGSALPQAKKAFAALSGMSKGASTIFGFHVKVSPYTASLINGISGHSLEMDDIDKKSVVHPGVVVIPSAIAIAEEMEAEGSNLIESVVAGYEVVLRLGECLGRDHYTKFHSTATCGVFGSTAASGKLLGLNDEQMEWAFGNAGSFATGLWQFIEGGGETKPLHAGKASSEGILVSLLAAKRYSGPKGIIEGEKGLCTVMSEHPDYDTLRKAGFRIMDVSFKLYPSCRHTHAAIDAALALREQVDEIQSVEIYTYKEAIQIAGFRNPSTPFEGKFSVPYCVAIALLDGNVRPEQFDVSNLGKTEVRKILARTVLKEKKEFSMAFPDRWMSEVVVNNTLSRLIEFPKGDPENPARIEDLWVKYEGMLRYAGVDADLTTIIDFFTTLEKRTMDELGELVY